MNTTVVNLAPNPVPAAPAEPARPRTDASRAVIAGGLLAALLVLGMGGASALVDISGAVVASGYISPLGRPKTVQHLDGGIVREILVRNGSEVRKGDLLIRLDDTELRANADVLRNRLQQGLARHARLEAERDGRAAIDWQNAVPDGLEPPLALSPAQRAMQQQTFAVRRSSRGGRVVQLAEKVQQMTQRIAGVRGLMQAKTEQKAMVDSELQSLRDLLADGFVGAARLLPLERERAALVGDLAEQTAELARLEHGIEEARIELRQADLEFQEKLLAELREVGSETQDLLQQYRATQEKLRRIEIRAPAAGRVHELNVVTVGGVIAPGAALMHVVSADQGLVVEASVEPHFIDQVSPGQPATVRFPAFSREDVSELQASVQTISPTSVLDERSGQSFFRVELRIEPAELARLDARAVGPGMPVEVFLRTGDRSVLSYLLKPMTDQFKRALREK